MDWDESTDYETTRGRTLAHKLTKSIQSLAKQLDGPTHAAEIRLLREESVQLLRALHERDSKQYEPCLSRALYDLGTHLYNAGHWERAEKTLREAARLYRQRYNADSASEDNCVNLAQTLRKYAKSLEKLGRMEEAQRNTSEALTLRRRTFESRSRGSGMELQAYVRNYGDFLFSERNSASDSE